MELSGLFSFLLRHSCFSASIQPPTRVKRDGEDVVPFPFVIIESRKGA